MSEHRSSGATSSIAVVKAARAYSVATLGFESPERRALRGVLALSEQGEPIFRPFVEAPGKNPDAVIVNADEPNALRNAMSLKQSGRLRNVVPVFVSRAPEVAGARYLLTRPILPAQLLTLLEQVVIEEHGYVPLDTTDAQDRLIVLSTEEAVAAVMAAAARVAARAPALAAVAVAPVATVASTVAVAPVAAVASAAAVAPVAAVASAAAPAPDEAAAPVAAAAPAADTPTSALVIDGSLAMRIRMRNALAPVVSRVDFAGSGAQALERIESQHYSLIFLDADLPGQDAYGICRRIRNHPLQRRTPVVLLTSGSVPADRVKGRDAGCDTYLVKPVREVVLLQIVAQFVGTTGERGSAPLASGALAP
jgi:CheY-like chemotaxis protein